MLAMYYISDNLSARGAKPKHGISVFCVENFALVVNYFSEKCAAIVMSEQRGVEDLDVCRRN